MTDTHHVHIDMPPLGHVLLTIYSAIFGFIGLVGAKPVLDVIFVAIGILTALCNLVLMYPKIVKIFKRPREPDSRNG